MYLILLSLFVSFVSLIIAVVALRLQIKSNKQIKEIESQIGEVVGIIESVADKLERTIAMYSVL